MRQDDHKIDADDRTIFDVLNERKYTVDYFQREYSWQQKHIEQLITDLTSTFLDVYTEGDPRPSGRWVPFETIVLTVVPGTLPAGTGFHINWLKIRSGTRQTPVAQAASRQFTVVFEA